MTRRISTADAAARCTHLTSTEQDTYRLMLDSFRRLDLRSGTATEFHLTTDQDTVICYRKTRSRLMGEHNPALLERPEALIMGLNYSLAAQRLVAMSRLDAATQADLTKKIKQTERNFIRAVKACKDTESPELIRESFIRDDLGMLLTLYKVSLPNDSPIKTLKKAVRYLDTTKNWVGLGLEPFQLKTRGSIEDEEGNPQLQYERVDKPITRTSEALKAEYRGCDDKPWFQTLSPLEQALTKSYQDVLTHDGYIIPSQLRVSLIGPFNYSQTVTRVKYPTERDYRPIATSTHTASNVPANPKLSDEERLRLTQLVQADLETTLGGRGVHVTSLLSQTGDRLLLMKDFYSKQVPGTYLDAIIVEFTQSAAEFNERVKAINICFNQFRFGEDDCVEAITAQMHLAEGLIRHITNLEKHLQATLSHFKGEEKTKSDLENSQHFLTNLSSRKARLQGIVGDIAALLKKVQTRVKQANEVVKQKTPAPSVLIKMLMQIKARDAGVDARFIEQLSKHELRRIGLKRRTEANKKSKQEVNAAFKQIDGKLNGAKLLFSYSRLLDAMRAITSPFQQELSESGAGNSDGKGAQLFKAIAETRVPALVFNCASGENRTLGYDNMHAVFSLWKYLCQPKWDEPQKQALLKRIFDTLTHDQHMQLRAGSAFGSAGGTIGLREKSKDSAMAHPAFHGDTISRMYRRSADAKAIRRNLTPLREWWLHCYIILNSHTGGLSNLRDFPAFEAAHTLIGRQLKQAAVIRRDPSGVDPKQLSKPMTTLFNGIEADCSATGVFAGTPLTHHPLWRSFEKGLALEQTQTRCEQIAQEAWDALMALDKSTLPNRKRRALFPPPILTKAILARDALVMALRSHVHFHGWSAIESKDSSFEQTELGDITKQAVETLNRVYQKYRFSDNSVLQEKLDFPLKVLFQAWSELEANDAPKEADKTVAKKLKALLASLEHPANSTQTIIAALKTADPLIQRSASAPAIKPITRKTQEPPTSSPDTEDTTNSRDSKRLSQRLGRLFATRQVRAHTVTEVSAPTAHSVGGGGGGGGGGDKDRRPESGEFLAALQRRRPYSRRSIGPHSVLRCRAHTEPATPREAQSLDS